MDHRGHKFSHALPSTQLNPNFSNPQSSVSPFAVLASGFPFTSAHFIFKRIALMSTPAQIAANQANGSDALRCPATAVFSINAKDR
jgi:hypothetical protein